jgi:4,5-DOPA dioxygenase extradiol
VGTPNFADWMRDRLHANDLDALLDWHARAPHARRAHPTVEHLMPLFRRTSAPRATRRHAPPAPVARIRTLALDAFAFG